MVKKNREFNMLFLVRTTGSIMTLFKRKGEEAKRSRLTCWQMKQNIFKYFGVNVSLWIFVYDIIFLFLMLRDRKTNYLPFIKSYLLKSYLLFQIYFKD